MCRNIVGTREAVANSHGSNGERVQLKSLLLERRLKGKNTSLQTDTLEWDRDWHVLLVDEGQEQIAL